MPTAIFTACACILGAAAPCDQAAKSPTPPDQLIDAICDESLDLRTRYEYTLRLDDFEELTAEQLEKLHHVFTDNAATNKSACHLPVDQLGRLGNQRTLRILLKHQGVFRVNGKRRLTMLAALHRLSSKLKIDIWRNLPPYYRHLWQWRGYQRVDGPELEDIPGEEPLRVYPENPKPAPVQVTPQQATAPATPGCATGQECRRP